jgi:cell surface protein SprA
MNRYVLFTFFCSVFLAGLISISASADFFDGSLLVKKSEQYFLNKTHTVQTTLGIIEPQKEDPAEQFTPRILPPVDFTKPAVSFTDSIDIEKTLIKQIRNIQGLRTEIFSYMNMDYYLRKKLERKFDANWSDNSKRKISDTDARSNRGKTSLAELDFVVPGSKTLARVVGGETRININGSERITFSGRSEWTEGQIETSANKNSSFPSLTMKQEPQFRINGDIGGRIIVDIKQDPQSGQLSNLEDNINIKYQGKDDEIIKHIEAGNTSLTLEGATFAGYRGSHKGLFGIRAEGQLGPLNFTTIASQEKSEANIKSFRGSAEETSNQIRDYNYKANTYFFIDNVYRERFKQARDSFDRVYYVSADSLATFEVYVDDGNIGNNLNEGTFALRGAAEPMYVDSDKWSVTDSPVDGYFHRLDPLEDYYVDRSLGYIRFTRTIPDEWTVGVYIETSDGRVFGSLDYDTNDENSKIELKMIKRKKQRPTNVDTWDLEWKNVYSLGQQQIDAEGLEIRIYREATDGVSRDTQDQTPLIHILGLDKNNELGEPKRDNKIDLNRGFINFFRGELIFPLLEPFNPDAPPAGVTVELKEKVPVIYDSQNREEKVEASKYYIEVKTASKQSIIQIGEGFTGIMEGTEQVILDGKPLSRGNDYRIDYFSGKITLLNEDAMSPTADLVIRYEEPNVMQQTQKTLLGVRGEYDLWGKSRLGSVLLYKNETTPDRRVKLGQEPSRTVLFDADGLFDFDSRFLTKALDVLPLLVASEPSNIRIETEIARSMPNMNTRGVVYIDDFEGSHNTPMSIIRPNWTTSSPPHTLTTNGNKLTRGKFNWYNPWNRVKSKDIWPKKETSAGENTVHVLNLLYEKPVDVPKDEAFGGVLSSFYGSGLDMSRSRFIEVWARGSKGDLKIDLGSISEDFYPLEEPNGLLNTEDKPIPGQALGDGILVKDEDTGLDGLFNSQEPGYSSDNTDPSDDNFKYDKNDYSRINGTEGNASDGDRAGVPDTEDINRNGILDTRNAYYEYTISFENTQDKYLVPDSVPEADPYGWRLFRIPLWNNPDARATHDNLTGTLTPPDSTLIEYARLWITNTDKTSIQIASIEIVESNWLEHGILGPEGEELPYESIDRIRISSVNTHENLEYKPPPGVRAEIDRTTKIRRKEQSLLLKVEELDAGNTAFIYRNFEKMDFTDYTSLNMFAHGPETGDFPIQGSGASDVELILRFGGDKKNYYEYHTGVYKGWASGNELNVDFQKCTALKLLPWSDRYIAHPDSAADTDDEWYQAYLSNPDSVSATLDFWYQAYLDHPDFVVPPSDTVGTKIYTLKGRPSLENIKILSIGVKNNKESGRLSSDIWVDELRMDSLRDMTGTAARVNFTTDLSGIINLSGSATQKSADFHDMNAKKGSGQENTQWNTSVKMNLDRLTPKRWNLSLPVSANISETSQLPRLKSGSDIILEESQKRNYQSKSSNKKYRLSYRKSVDRTQTGIKAVLSSWIFEKANASYDWGERKSSSPFSGQNISNNQQLNVGYDVGLKTKMFKPFLWLPHLPFDTWEKLADMEYTYTPSQLSYSYIFNENNAFRTNIDGVSDTTKTSTSAENINFGYNPFRALKYSYTQTKTNDLYLKQETNFKERNQISITGPEIFYVTHNYNYNADYTEQDNPRYSLSSQLGSKFIGLNKSFDINARFSWEKFFEDISGKPKPPKKRYEREKRERKERKTNEKSDEADDDTKGRKDNIDPDKKEQSARDGEKAPAKDANSAKEDKKNSTINEKKNTTVKESSKNSKETAKEKKPGTGIRTKMLTAVSKTLSPITIDYKTSEQLSYAGIEDRPDFMIRFGRGTVEEPDTLDVVARQNSISRTSGVTANTKMNLPFDIGISVSTEFNDKEQISASANTESEDITLPRMSFNWSRLEEKIPFVKKYLQNITYQSSFLVRNTKNWQNEIKTSDRINNNFTPLTLSAKVLNLFDVNFSLTTTLQSNQDFSGTTKSYSETKSNSTTSQIRYRLTSSKGIPIFKNFRLKSDINMTLNFSTSNEETRRGIGDEAMSLVSTSNQWTFTPTVDYRFSQKFRGGMKMDFRNMVDMTKQMRKVREVSIWGELNF